MATVKGNAPKPALKLVKQEAKGDQDSLPLSGGQEKVQVTKKLDKTSGKLKVGVEKVVKNDRALKNTVVASKNIVVASKKTVVASKKIGVASKKTGVASKKTD